LKNAPLVITCPLCGAILPPVSVTNPFTGKTKHCAPWVPCLTCREQADREKAERIEGRFEAARNPRPRPVNCEKHYFGHNPND
jgi:hypothetical protein